jgi:hypothetical protein
MVFNGIAVLLRTADTTYLLVELGAVATLGGFAPLLPTDLSDAPEVLATVTFLGGSTPFTPRVRSGHLLGIGHSRTSWQWGDYCLIPPRNVSIAQ